MSPHRPTFRDSRRASSGHLSWQGAFTLLELLLVCALLAILAGLVAPAFAGSQGRARLDATARAVVAFSRAARARASADGRAYFLIVDPVAKQVRLARQRDPLASPDAEGDAETESDAWADGAPWARAYDLPEDVKVSFVSTTYQDVQTSVLTTTPGTTPAGSATTALPGSGVVAGAQVVIDETKPARVAFEPDGTADDATIDFVGQGNAKVRIIIDSPSGRARILTGQELTDALAAQAQSSSPDAAPSPPAVLGTVAPLPSPPAGGQ